MLCSSCSLSIVKKQAYLVQMQYLIKSLANKQALVLNTNLVKFGTRSKSSRVQNPPSQI